MNWESAYHSDAPRTVVCRCGWRYHTRLLIATHLERCPVCIRMPEDLWPEEGDLLELKGMFGVSEDGRLIAQPSPNMFRYSGAENILPTGTRVIICSFHFEGEAHGVRSFFMTLVSPMGPKGLRWTTDYGTFARYVGVVARYRDMKG